MTDEWRGFQVASIVSARKSLPGLYEGYEKSITAEQAAHIYKLKYQREPSTVVDAGSIWLAGGADQ